MCCVVAHLATHHRYHLLSVSPAAFKITISANRTPPQLSALFQDLMALAPPGVAQQLMSGGAGERWQLMVLQPVM
jgi:hypothetical protein